MSCGCSCPCQCNCAKLKMSSPTDKFVSPFIHGDNTQVLDTSNSFQLNLLNFNDSLAEDLMPLDGQVSAKPGLDDSLCMEDDTQLPTDQPTLLPESNQASSLQPSNVPTGHTMQKSSQVLDDSLVDDDQTQLSGILLLSPIQDSKAYFEDSLCMEDDTQLPTEQAALPQDTAEDSVSSDKKRSSVVTRDSNDEVQSMKDPQNSVTDGKTGLDASKHSPEADTSSYSEKNSKYSISPSSSDQENQSGPDSAKVKPSFRKRKSFAPPTLSSKQLSPQSESQPASKPTSTEAKGTSKKFTIPKISKAKLSESSNTTEDKDNQISAKPQFKKPEPTSSEVAKKTPQKPAFSIPKKPKAKLKGSSNDKESRQPSDSASTTAKSSVTKSAHQKPFDNKENVAESTLAKPTSKRSKTTTDKPKATKPIDPKKAAAKEEKEKKRLEREKVKLEKEEAKREKEQLKEEKKLEQERKKAEREQKKMEKELKKMEKSQATVSKKQKSKTTEASAPEDNVSTAIASTTEESLTSKTALKLTDIADEINEDKKESSPKPEQLSIESDAQSKELSKMVESAPEENSSEKDCQDEQGDECNNDKHESTAAPNQPSEQGERCTENQCNGKTDPSISKTQDIKKNENRKRKQTSSTSSAPAMKKFKPDFKSESKTTNNPTKPTKTKRSSTKKTPAATHTKPDSPKVPRSKPTNYSGPVWVQCDDCEKWRRLLSVKDPSFVPDQWTCSLNDDTGHAQCSAPEEVWSDLGDSQEFVESPYIPGSLVWAKMDGYPWWPAMVEEDPDEEAYYELGRGSNPIPVRYHVVFLDTPVCRAWVHSHNTRTFTDSTDPNDENRVNVPKKYKRSLKMATKWASKAMGESFKERLGRFSFSQRSKRGSKKRKPSPMEGSDSQEGNSTASLPAPKPGGRKSARLVLTKTQLRFEESTQPADESSSIEEDTKTQDSMTVEIDSSMVTPSKTAMDAQTIKDSAFEGSAVAGTTSTSQLLCMAEE